MAPPCRNSHKDNAVAALLEHSTVSLDAGCNRVGGSWSSMMKLASAEFSFPHSSRTVKVTGVAPQKPVGGSTYDQLQVTSGEQLSVASPPPWSSSQSKNIW